MLRTHSGVIQASGNAMGALDLSIIILQQQRSCAVQYTGSTLRREVEGKKNRRPPRGIHLVQSLIFFYLNQSGTVEISVDAVASSIASNNLHASVINERVKPVYINRRTTGE